MRRRWPDILGITGIKPPMRVFFKKNKPARKWNPNAGCSAANHWAKKFLKKFEGTQPCPAKKSSNYFWIPTSENPAFFQNPKTAPKLQFSVFFNKYKRKKQTRIKRKRGWNPLYWKTREQRNFKRVLYGRFGLRHNFSKNCPQDPKMG